MVLLRGRVVYFGPSGGEALDYVAGLPAAAAVPRQRGIGDAVRTPWGCMLTDGGWAGNC
jgi:hypothetical protein